MSLVVCSNQEKDGKSLRQPSSVYNAWSFRNPLSSTMTIPANAQIALQSCKVNVDGRVVFSGNNHRFYHYLGQKLDIDGETAPQNVDTTSQSVLVDLLSNDQKGEVLELSVDEFANQLQERIQQETFHPNFKEQFQCDPLRNASSLDFLGYKFTYKQNASTENARADLDFDIWYHEGSAKNFTYKKTGGDVGTFKRVATGDGVDEPSVALAPNKPLSLTRDTKKIGEKQGVFEVDIRNGSFANVQASGVEWKVGLSRCVNIADGNGRFYPEYADETNDDGNLRISNPVFADFAVARNADGELVCYHHVMDDSVDDGKKLVAREVKYYENANSSFAGGDRFNLSTGTDAVNYNRIALCAQGENIRALIHDNASSAWRLITEFDAAVASESYFKPVNQACWCLHPFLEVGDDENNASCTMRIREFDTPVGLTKYAQPTKTNQSNAGWWELNEALNTEGRCQEVEMREWNKPGNTGADAYVFQEQNASDGVDLDPVLVLEPSTIYKRTEGANGKSILGFEQSIVDVPVSGDNTNTIVFDSSTIPSLQSSMAMFVRLNNFTQNVMNAYTGNRSKILAHLPRFDNAQSTGRLYFEPNNMVFIDLDNPAPLQVNEFDISFNYVNEQYATSLTGQSIVCLYIREKPK